MMKRILLSAGLGALVAVAGVAFNPASADHDTAEENCGGEYTVAVEADTSDAPGPITGYCSDGTFGGLGVPPNADYHSSCGGENEVTVETDNIDVPAGPIHSTSYCSDGTIDGINDLLP